MKRDLLWYRRHVIVAVSFAALVAFPQRGTLGQDGAGDGVIEASTNLSEALPASQWAQVESSVDRGLRWLANVQADDGRFPSGWRSRNRPLRRSPSWHSFPAVTCPTKVLMEKTFHGRLISF